MSIDTSPPAPETTGADLDWRIYRGGGQRHDDIDRLPPPPRWRRFRGGELIEPRLPADDPGVRRAEGYQITDDAIEMVNAALYLRRPLLVTGKPGTGKSTLAYSIAAELMLGPVLHWPITSRSRLDDGLYRYDAIGRLQESNLVQVAGTPQTGEDGRDVPDVGRYVTLGPLGTALLPQARPRVLLIDELDKSDIDLPNDLLNVFEEGRFEIPELVRLPADQRLVEVMTADGTGRVPVRDGIVSCHAFPVVVITSNAEREFPQAFLRRCLRLDIRPPDERTLARIVESLLGPEAVERSGDAEGYVKGVLDRGERLMGFGHRVYRAEDPRARVLRRTAKELGAPRFEVAEALEKAALAELQARRPDRVLATNVEFWSAVVLDFAEVPAHMFTSMFTCARMGGWSAHILEQKRLKRLVRPSAKYVGPAPRKPSDVEGWDAVPHDA